MTQTITLELTDDLIARAREQAAHTDQPLEQILVQQLEVAFAPPLPTLASDEQVELDALEQLSTDALWTIAREQMPHEQQNRIAVLMSGNTKGNLTTAEYAELENLVEQGQRLMLRKAKASALMTERESSKIDVARRLHEALGDVKAGRIYPYDKLREMIEDNETND